MEVEGGLPLAPEDRMGLVEDGGGAGDRVWTRRRWVTGFTKECYLSSDPGRRRTFGVTEGKGPSL